MTKMNSLIPDKCPYCGTELTYDGVNLICGNEECCGRICAKISDCIQHFDIKGLGQAMVEDMVAAGLSNVFDLLSDDFREMMVRNGLKVTANVQKVFEQLDGIRSLDLYKVIMMMDYQGMGEQTAKQVANCVAGAPYNFSGLNKELVSKFEDGPEKDVVMAQVMEIESYGVSVMFPETGEDGEYPGIGIEMTGSPKPFFATKDEFLEYVKRLGYYHEKLAHAQILVTDSLESGSSKMNTARKKGLKIMTYEDFYNNGV